MLNGLHRVARAPCQCKHDRVRLHILRAVGFRQCHCAFAPIATRSPGHRAATAATTPVPPPSGRSRPVSLTRSSRPGFPAAPRSSRASRADPRRHRVLREHGCSRQLARAVHRARQPGPVSAARWSAARGHPRRAPVWRAPVSVFRRKPVNMTASGSSLVDHRGRWLQRRECPLATGASGGICVARSAVLPSTLVPRATVEVPV